MVDPIEPERLCDCPGASNERGATHKPRCPLYELVCNVCGVAFKRHMSQNKDHKFEPKP